MGTMIGIASLVLALLALRGHRPAYAAFVLVGLAYFPIRAGLPLHPRACELAPDFALLLSSLRNWGHVVLFALFFVMSAAQWPAARAGRWPWAFAATLAMGALVELAQGVTGHGHCRIRDLLPDMAGAALGALVLLGWEIVRRGRRGPFASATS